MDSENNADVFKKIHPTRYLKDHLEHGIRPIDNRKKFSYRSVTGNVNVVKKCCGSSIVKIGNTTIICGIRHEVAKPSVKYPKRGILDISCKLSERCNVSLNLKNKVVQLRHCTNLLLKLFVGLKVVDLESLCIFTGQLAWVLRVYIICVDYDGGFWDGSILAAYLALKSAILPIIEYKEDLKSFRPVDGQTQIKIGQLPLATTFGLFQDYVFMDPNKEEEELCTSFIIVVNDKDNIRICEKRGGTPIDDKFLNECLELSKNRYQMMNSAVEIILKHVK